MIGRLTGILREKQPPELLIDVQGVGYEVEAPMSTFYQLPKVGEEVSLFTHMVVREDAQLLYGFSARQERLMFRTLIKISGVGPKLALAILSSIEAEQFARTIQEGDSAALVKIPGVGKKTAERLLVELKDRLEGFWQPSDLLSSEPANNADQDRQAQLDAESALVALGYKAAQAEKAIKAVTESGIGCDELIRRALRNML